MNILKRAAVVVSSVIAVLGGTLFLQPTTATAQSCPDVWTIGVGGFVLGGWQESAYFNADQRIGYNVWNPVEGKNWFSDAMWNMRNACPATHITAIGHSEGAGLIHAWVTENQGFPNANAVLIGDPKRNGWDTGAGMARFGGSLFPGYPLAGVDDWFGDFPTLQVCRWDDGVCRTEAGPNGYIEGRHGWYNFNVWDYTWSPTGTWMIA